MISNSKQLHVQLLPVFASINYRRKNRNTHELTLYISTLDVISRADDFPRMLELKNTIDHLNTKTILFSAE